MWRPLLIPLAFISATASADTAPKKNAKDPSRIEITVNKRGFDPGEVHVPANKPLTLVFTRTTEQTCTKSVVLTLDDGKKLERELPLDQAVEVPVTFKKAGNLSYACSMDMTKGIIVVK